MYQSIIFLPETKFIWMKIKVFNTNMCHIEIAK